MESQLYPWKGEFKTGNPEAPIAVVTLARSLSLPGKTVAIHGRMKTENLGVEKVVANTISNPNIRFLIVFGEEIRGHKAGGSLISLHRNGVDESGKIIDAPGAVPYIENIDEKAIKRFQEQVEIINLLGEKDMEILVNKIDECGRKNPEDFGEPFIAIRYDSKESDSHEKLDDMVALHSSIRISPYLEVTPMQISKQGLKIHSNIILQSDWRVINA